MPESVESLLHQRIATHCLPRYRAGYYKDAVAEAMTQVERAIKERAGITELFGVRMVKTLFGAGTGIKLRVPFGEHMQEPAQRFLEGAFAYYRNYAHHEGDRIDGPTCLRVLVMASDLLDLVGATALSFADVGGIPGLVSTGVFSAPREVYELLRLLKDEVLPDEECGGFYDDLFTKGFVERHVQAVIEFGLVEYRVEQPVLDPNDDVDSLGIFELTPLGRSVLQQAGDPA